MTSLPPPSLHFSGGGFKNGKTKKITLEKFQSGGALKTATNQPDLFEGTTPLISSTPPLRSPFCRVFLETPQPIWLHCYDGT